MLRLAESISYATLLQVYQKLYPQLSFSFDKDEAIKYLEKLILAYADAIGKGNRGQLNVLIKNPELSSLWKLLQNEIRKEYGSSHVTLYRGVSVSVYNKDFKDLKVGDIITLESYASNNLSGFTDDLDIATSFAQCGNGLPQGTRQEDQNTMDYYETTDTQDWSSMIGFVFEAQISVLKLYFAPKLMDNYMLKILFKEASKRSNATSYELSSESEWIVKMPIKTKIKSGYIYVSDPDSGYEEWEDSKHPYKDHVDAYKQIARNGGG